MKKGLLLAMAAVLFVGFSSYAQRVIGYYAGWENAYSSIQYNKLTDVNYAFAEPKTNNTVGFQDAFQQNLFTQFVNYVKNQQTLNPNIRINISIGGADQTLADRFHTIGSNASSASAFASSCVDFCLLHGLDGIDIDWEPVISSNSSSFTTLMKELREEIDARAPQLQLSAAVFPEGFQGATGVPNAGVTSASFQYVDFFSLMCYDYGTPDFASHSPEDRIDDAIAFWQNTKGLTKSKMVLGLPFYGRSSYWAYSRNDQIKYSALVSQYGGAAAAGSDSQGNWRYNGQATIKSKTSTAITEGLKGVMIWEISQDVTGQYSLLNSVEEAIDEAGCPKPNLGDSKMICGQADVTLASGLDQSTTSFVWKRNNQVIGGATGPNYTANQGGTYEVEATKNGTTCTKTSIVSVVDVFDAPDLGNGVPLCGGETVVIDADLGIPGLTYSWSNGSSVVSTTSELSFNTSATYTVTVTDPFSHCSSQTADVIASPSALSVEGAENCAGVPSTLLINSTGGPYSWFEQENGGSFVHVGNEYEVTPSSTKTYYVQNTGGSQTKYVGLDEQGDGTNFGSYTTYQDVFVMKIEVNQSLTIDSVTVFPDWSLEEVSFDIELLSGMTESGGQVVGSSGTVVSTKTLTYEADGGPATPVRFALDMEIATPGTYFLRIVNPDVLLFYGQISDKPFGDPEYERFDYPFEFENVMSIITSYGWGGWEDVRTYGGIYDWRISTGATCPRVPVTATVKACDAPTVTISSTDDDIFTGETVTITAAGLDADGDIAGMQITQDGSIIQEGVSSDGNGNYTIDLTFDNAGDYEICAVAVDDDGLESSESCITITVGVVGFDELETSELTVFPNPSSDNFMISTDFNETFVATVIDAKGIVVETRTVNGADQVQLGASLNKGIYTIQLISNQRLLQSKVVKN